LETQDNAGKGSIKVGKGMKTFKKDLERARKIWKTFRRRVNIWKRV